jgi:uncharacterized protein (TIGR00645 family)
MPNTRPRLETAIEVTLFASRWLLAPFYLGMVVALGVLLFVFGRELVTELAHLSAVHSEEAILLALSLIDLSLTGNLLLIAVQSAASRAGSANGNVHLPSSTSGRGRNRRTV